jgi:hypothetical protein
VFDLVRWSFVIAITPLALSLAWRLISLLGNAIVFRLARSYASDRLRGFRHNISRQCTSRYISASGWTPSMGSGRSLSSPRFS